MPVQHLSVTLYSRPGCHLCDDLREDLSLLAAELDLRVDEVDISSDPQLLERFQHLIPVVDVAGGPLLMAPLTLVQLREALSPLRG